MQPGLAPLPFSKELYPIGWRRGADGNQQRPKVACHYLLEKMRRAEITKAYIVIREGKWDIPAYLRDGSMLDMHLGYFVVGRLRDLLILWMKLIRFCAIQS